jgi:hypothetical protein
LSVVVIRKFIRAADELFMEQAWKRLGRPCPPPPTINRRILASLVRDFAAEIFVETGTHLGDTVAFMKDHVGQVHSIELGQDLFKNAQRRFADCPGVKLWQGDSGDILPVVLQSVAGRCVFWLDGHYSAGITARGLEDTPVLRELTHIFSASIPPYLIVIDDARCFNGTGGYPCLASLEAHVEIHRPDFQIACGLDAICIFSRDDQSVVAAVAKALLA